MILVMRRLPQLAGPQGDDYHGRVPQRALLMRPEAAEALLAFDDACGGAVYTDIYRSPPEVLAAHRAKGGTQPVGYSFHEFGGPVDVEVGETLKKLSWSYDDLCLAMAEHGFYCHRRDKNPTASESWHFNFLGQDAEQLLALCTDDHQTWARPAEAMIQKWYGDQLRLDAASISAALQAAGCTSVHEFQEKWDLVADGVAGPITQRVLACVTAEIQIVDPQPAA